LPVARVAARGEDNDDKRKPHGARCTPALFSPP
jgi:hypothetical protein